MVFFCTEDSSQGAGNWTFVIVTDRVELDEQIAKTFAGLRRGKHANVSHAESGAELRELSGWQQPLRVYHHFTVSDRRKFCATGGT